MITKSIQLVLLRSMIWLLMIMIVKQDSWSSTMKDGAGVLSVMI